MLREMFVGICVAHLCSFEVLRPLSGSSNPRYHIALDAVTDLRPYHDYTAMLSIVNFLQQGHFAALSKVYRVSFVALSYTHRCVCGICEIAAGSWPLSSLPTIRLSLFHLHSCFTLWLCSTFRQISMILINSVLMWPPAGFGSIPGRHLKCCDGVIFGAIIICEIPLLVTLQRLDNRSSHHPHC